MKNVINDPKVIQEICVDIMNAGAIPDAKNIQAYLNLRKDLWGGPEDRSVYRTAIHYSRNEIGNKVYLLEIQTVPTEDRFNGVWAGVMREEVIAEQMLRKFLEGKSHE